MKNNRTYTAAELKVIMDKKKALQDAAPDLLKALRNLLDACEFWEDQEDPVLAQARAAIAKAEGK